MTTGDDVIAAFTRWDEARRAYGEERRRYVSAAFVAEGRLLRAPEDVRDRATLDRLGGLQTAERDAFEAYRRTVDAWEQ